jgi:hypothetical protein
MARRSYYGVDVYNNLPSGFEARSNYAYNPTSGSYLFQSPSGQQMLDAPWLSKPIPFGGTNYGSQPAPAAVKQKAQQGITITPAGSNKPKNNNNQITITGGTGPEPTYGNSNKNKNKNKSSAPSPAPQQSAPAFDINAFLEEQERARIAAEERAKQEAADRLRRELMGQASALTGMASGYGINDFSQINSALAQLYGIQGQAAGAGVDLSNVDSTISNLRGLLDQRETEQGRYDDFVNTFNTAASQAQGYGVNDLDAINSAMGQFQGYQSGATGFNSDLDVDTSFVRERSGSVLDQLQRTLDERNRQLGVVADTRSQLEDFIGNFGDAYQAVDYRNADQINALEAGLDPINSGTIDGIDVNFDFSDLAAQTGGFNEMLGNLRERRGRALDDYGSELTGFGEALGGISADSDDFNATQVYGARDDYIDMQNQLGAFGSGDRVNSFREQLFGLDEQYAALSDALGERQEGVESNARSFVENLLGGSYTALNQLQTERARLNELQGNRNRFDAYQSDDELMQATNIINQQQRRLEEEDRIRRARAERERMMGGNTVATPAFARQFMNDAEYQAFLASLEQAREDPFAAGQATSFARSLGLA